MNLVETENFIILEKIMNERLQFQLKYLIYAFLGNYIIIKMHILPTPFDFVQLYPIIVQGSFTDRHNANHLRFFSLHISIVTKKEDFFLVTPNNTVTFFSSVKLTCVITQFHFILSWMEFFWHLNTVSIFFSIVSCCHARFPAFAVPIFL